MFLCPFLPMPLIDQFGVDQHAVEIEENGLAVEAGHSRLDCVEFAAAVGEGIGFDSEALEHGDEEIGEGLVMAG